MPNIYTSTKQIAESIVREEQKSTVYPDTDAFIDRVIEVKIVLGRFARKLDYEANFLRDHEARKLRALFHDTLVRAS